MITVGEDRKFCIHLEICLAGGVSFDVTLVGSTNGWIIFLFSSATHENNGTMFKYTDTSGLLILIVHVLCKLLYYIIYIDISI